MKNSSAYSNHTQRHLQTHLDKWATKQSEGEKKTIGNDIPHDLMRELLKVFERYRIDDNKEIVCLWRQKTGQFNCVMRPVEREQELIDRLKEWIELGN